MLIGVPKEIKELEYRVGLVPASVRELVHHGHQVIIETLAGYGIGFEDEDYIKVGAKIAATAQDIFASANMIIKVKEPQPVEYGMLREDQILFTFLHLAPDPIQAQGLMDSNCIALAYETVTDAVGRLPLLAPMSEVAGRMAAQSGAHFLESPNGGAGVMLGGVPGVAPAQVIVIGGGVVGINAARMCLGLGAEVIVLDKNPQRLRELDALYGPHLKTIVPTIDTIESYVCRADLVIGAVLVPGGAAPKLITKEMIKCMKRGSVIVDVAIDQGGCAETSRPTSHNHPTYVIEDVIHYCVTNMPGAVPRTSAFALNNATLPFVLEVANKGLSQALQDNPYLRQGLNIYRGAITHKEVARALNTPYLSPEKVLG